MNSFGLDIDNLDSQQIAEATDPRNLDYERLPGVPAIMTRNEVALVAGVSLPTVDRMIADGMLVETRFKDGDTGILRQDFLACVETNLLCNRPVLEGEEEV